MSDFSSKSEEFIASRFVHDVCKGKKLTLRAGGFQFKQGWAAIFADFVERVGNYNIGIYKASDEFQFLDIEVEISRTSNSKRVYTEILRAKYMSFKTCAVCGCGKPENGVMLCEKCSSNSAELKATGTWLDTF